MNGVGGERERWGVKHKGKQAALRWRWQRLPSGLRLSHALVLLRAWLCDTHLDTPPEAHSYAHGMEQHVRVAHYTP